MTVENLVPRLITYRDILPTTTYFEIDSLISNARYAIWITLPMDYSPENSTGYPVIYVQDGNLFAPFIGCFSKVFSVDVICPIKPFIAVSIGYTPEDYPRCSSLRMRDLIPPGEPVSPMMMQALEHNVQAGLLTEKEKETAIAGMKNNRADLFHEFICKELHPIVTQKYNVDKREIGLFGYSYGGLFALYSAFRSSFFEIIGACSPGMLSENTTIMQILQELQENGTEFSSRKLLMTINEKELTSQTFYREMGRCFAEVRKRIQQKPIPGISFFSDIIPGATHVTGATCAWFRFISEFYSEKQ